VKPIGLAYCNPATTAQAVLPQDLRGLQLFFAQMILHLNRLAGILYKHLPNGDHPLGHAGCNLAGSLGPFSLRIKQPPLIDRITEET